MVEVQKLRTFYDFCGARATLCADSRGRGSKTEDFLRFLRCARDLSAEIRVVEVQKLGAFYDFCGARATSRGRGSKTEDFLRFLACARDPLRRFAWSRFKN